MTDGTPARRVIFLHLPKTGGATLQTIIVRNVPPASLHLQRVPGPTARPGAPSRRRDDHPRASRGDLERREFQRYGAADLARLRVVIGHYLYGLHKALPGPSTYITMLRDPVDRVLSLYHYRRTTEGLRASLDEYVASDPDLELDDGQTTAIAGEVLGGPRDAEEMARLLARAKDNLQRSFALVGITERFDESVALLGRAFGWRRLGYVPRNVARGRPRRHEVADATLERILDRNRRDVELHRFASQLFDRQLAEIDPPIDADVRRIRRRNRAYRRVPVVLRAADRAARIRVEAAQRRRTESTNA